MDINEIGLVLLLAWPECACCIIHKSGTGHPHFVRYEGTIYATDFLALLTFREVNPAEWMHPVLMSVVSDQRRLTSDGVSAKPLTESFHSAVVAAYLVDSILTSQRHQLLELFRTTFCHA